MLKRFRRNFQTVQEGIASSFKNLPVKKQTKDVTTTSSEVRYTAGAEILQCYQSEWKKLHKTSEENARKAQNLDNVIENVHKTIEKQWSDVNRMCSALTSIPPLLKDVQDLMEQLGVIHNLCGEVETGLLNLEDIIETQELQEKQLEHRFQFALYKEKKLAELDKIREILAKEHAEKVRQHEMKQEEILQERQETFKKAFDSDIEEFKRTGTVPKLQTVNSKTVEKAPSLEEVEIEPDDPSALDKFLSCDNNLKDT